MENLKNININEWTKTGEGGNAETFANLKDDTIILKLAKNNVIGLNSMKEEFACIDKAMQLNINTPKMIEKVICNGRLGIIYERIHNKKSLGQLCHDNPEKIKYYAQCLARETAILHSKKCDVAGMTNYKQFYIDTFKYKQQDKILTPKIIQLIENETFESNTLIHGDLTVGNLIYSNDKWYWIDLGRMGYGDPVFDLIDAYYSFNILSKFKFVNKIFHMSHQQSIELWDSFIEEYAKLTNQNLDELIKRIKRLSVAFFFKIWATGRHFPILYNIVNHNVHKYYKKMIGDL